MASYVCVLHMYVFFIYVCVLSEVVHSLLARVGADGLVLLLPRHALKLIHHPVRRSAWACGHVGMWAWALCTKVLPC